VDHAGPSKKYEGSPAYEASVKTFDTSRVSFKSGTGKNVPLGRKRDWYKQADGGETPCTAPPGGSPRLGREPPVSKLEGKGKISAKRG